MCMCVLRLAISIRHRTDFRVNPRSTIADFAGSFDDDDDESRVRDMSEMSEIRFHPEAG